MKLILFYIFLIIFLNSCDSSSGNSDDGSLGEKNSNSFPEDKVKPYIVSVSPNDSSSSISVNTNIIISFSEKIDSNSITINATSNLCSGTIQISSNNFSSCLILISNPMPHMNQDQYIIKPSSNFNYSTTYKIRIKSGIKDLAGNSLAGDYLQKNGYLIVGAYFFLLTPAPPI